MTEYVQKLISISTQHLQLADQVSSPSHKYFLRYLADKFNMSKFSKGPNSQKYEQILFKS